MALFTTRFSITAAAYGFASAVKLLITDTFTRSSGSTLGSADTGQAWTAIAGTWLTNGTQGYTNTAGSSYPVATVESGVVDVTLSVSSSTGTGVAFWVTDANNWWSAASSDTNFSCGCTTAANCANCGGPNTCIPPSPPNCGTGVGCGQYIRTCQVSLYTTAANAGACAGIPGVWTSGTGCDGVSGNCRVDNSVITSEACCGKACYSCADETLCGCPTCTYGCTTCTTHNVKITKRVAGTVTTVSTTVVSGVVAAIKAILIGTGLTVRAYSNTAMTTQLGSDITATNPSTPTATKHGVAKITSDNQGTTVDNFNLQSN
jgi:hypothetical protein